MFHAGFTQKFSMSVHEANHLFAGADADTFCSLIAAENIVKLLFVAERAVWENNPALRRDLRALMPRLKTLCALIDNVLIVDGGEENKTIDQALLLTSCFESVNLCRHSAVVVIGGGAFLDTVGLAAALVHRGIRLIRVPSTALAQADSGIGVKNGVDAYGKKNFLGTFQVPLAVFNDEALLESLPDEVWREAIPEAVKVSMICNRAFFESIVHAAPALAQRDAAAMSELIHRSAQLHLHHITTSGDPFENGSARPLDFGHWLAHKLEPMSHYTLRHGQAVAIGLACDTFIALRRGFVAQDDFEALCTLLTTCSFSLYHPALDVCDEQGRRAILTGVDEFREHLGGTLHITLPRPLGARYETDYLDDDEILAALDELKKRSM